MNSSACIPHKTKPWPTMPGQKFSDQNGRGPCASAHAGFSLVELMVAMVIGLLGIIVMMQLFSVFEGQKRTTTGGDDAISTGVISLDGLQRDLQKSGWGISAHRLIGCAASGLNVGIIPIPLAPVTIYPSAGLNVTIPTGFPAVPDPDPNTDVLLIVSGNGNGSVEGDVITLVVGSSYRVHTPTAFVTGDRVVAAPAVRTALPCNVNLSTVANNGVILTPVQVDFAFGAATDLLFNLGQRPTVRGYAVRGGNLTLCDFATIDCTIVGNWVPIAENVVSLRAQYGRDTTDVAPLPPARARMDGVVDLTDVWDQQIVDPVAFPVSTDASKNTVACAVLRNIAVRVVLVARSSQPERTLDWPARTLNVTPNPPLWIGSGGAPISLPSPDPTWPTWRDFRYKTFQTVVPLRNITSRGAVSEC